MTVDLVTQTRYNHYRTWINVIKMKQYSFRQFVICAMIGAVFFSTVAPLHICLCEGCHCEHSFGYGFAKIKSDLPKPDSEPTGCCEKKNSENCCDNKHSQSKSQCLCVTVQKCDAIVPVTTSLVKELKFCPFWDVPVVSVAPFDQADTFWSSFLKERRGLLRPHVPLHVLLCVFLN